MRNHGDGRAVYTVRPHLKDLQVYIFEHMSACRDGSTARGHQVAGRSIHVASAEAPTWVEFVSLVAAELAAGRASPGR